jgi:hypothetical protein
MKFNVLLFAFLVFALLITGCEKEEVIPEDIKGTTTEERDNSAPENLTGGAQSNLRSNSFTDGNDVLVSAFFGLDNALPININLICRGGKNMDGMPVNFNYPIDPNTLAPEDFEVVDRRGNLYTPMCATLAPANEAGEARTVLLIGEFGNAVTNPPVEVRIVDDLFTAEQSTNESACSERINLNGLFTKNVVPLAGRPRMFFAQQIEGDIAECADAAQVIQLAWNGGVVPVDEDVQEADLFQFYTVFTDSAGVLIPHTPVSIADVNDNDNFHQLCLDFTDPVVKVTMPANIVEDPNGDPNWASEIEVSYCGENE